MASHHSGPAPQGHAAHGHDPMAPGADKLPAFAGLIIGGLALFAILYGTVILTNRQFAGHAKPAAAAPAAGAPAATTAPAAH